MNRIKELRKLKLLTQEDFAKQLNLSQGMVSGWETGRYEIASSYLEILAKFFGVSSDYILGIDSTPTKQQVNAPLTRPKHAFTAQDEELVRKFNMLDERDQEDVMDDIDRKLERQERRFAEEGKHA